MPAMAIGHIGGDADVVAVRFLNLLEGRTDLRAVGSLELADFDDGHRSRVRPLAVPEDRDCVGLGRIRAARTSTLGPCRWGGSEVNSVAKAGAVKGVNVKQRLNRTPSRAKASMAGDVSRG